MNKQDMELWEKHTEGIGVEELKKSVEKPAVFQVELCQLINEFLSGKPEPNIIEVGCEIGITSLLITDDAKKTLLDLNPKAIELSKKLWDIYHKKADFVVADMFNMPFEDKCYDMVFNAGVIEHFKENEVENALREYGRVLKDEGTMIIGFPNYKSFPYRLARFALTILGKWKFPEEYNYFDLKEQIKANNLVLIERKVLSKSSIYNWWDWCPPIKSLFKKTEKVFHWEGYLTVLIIKKDK